MGAFFDYRSILHDDDLVGVDDGGKPVGDDDDGAAAHGMIERLLYGGFRFRIERRGRLVEQEDRRLADQRAGDRQPLALAAGQRHAVFADRRVVALRLRANEVMRIGEPCRFLDLRVGRFRAAVADIVADRAFEEVRLLRNIGEAVAQRLFGDVGDVLPVDQDFAAGRVVRSAE